MKFDLPKDKASIIKVIGVGGGGSNAVNHMFNQGIKGVDFTVCNTDQQALDASPVPHKIQLGLTLTDGLGAGAKSEVGRESAIESIDDIKGYLDGNTKMVFITAGMGGGTGTGAAPVIAEIAKEMNLLTVGIVTMPFVFEGRLRRKQAEEGIERLRNSVDTLLIINNDKLREIYGNLRMSDAFAKADDVLTTAARGIAEIITRTGYVNVDFNDVNTVMRSGGVAIMGSASSTGEDRARLAIEEALSSPLLNDNNIRGAKYVLLNMEFGNSEVTMDEIAEITDYIQMEAGATAEVIWGYGQNDMLGEELSITVIATGFETKKDVGVELDKVEKRTLSFDKPEVKEQAPTAVPVNFSEPFIIKKAPVAPQAEQTAPFQKPAEVKPVEVKPVYKPEQPSFEFDLSEDLPASNAAVVAEIEEDVVETQAPIVAEAPKELPIEQPIKIEAKIEETPVAKIVHKLEEEPQQPAPAPKSVFAASQPAVQQAPVQQPTATQQMPSPAPQTSGMTAKEYQEKSKDKIMRIRDMSMKLRTPSGITELEKEPAFMRRKVNLDDVPHSSEDAVSRYTLGEEETREGVVRTSLKANNSFLHDNVD